MIFHILHFIHDSIWLYVLVQYPEPYKSLIFALYLHSADLLLCLV